MSNFKSLLTKPQLLSKSAVVMVLLLGLVGFADAVYLTVKHYVGGPVPCAIVKGCDTVLTSRYAILWGWPVSLYGAIFYLVVVVGVIGYLDNKKIFWLNWLRSLAVAGFLVTLWLVYVQAFLLKDFCLYCLISATSALVIFFRVKPWLLLLRRRVLE